MDCFWVTCSNEGRVESVTKIELCPSAEGANVIWNDNKKCNGKWKFIRDENGVGFFCIEFSANPYNWWRRHILRQVAKDSLMFELLDNSDPNYTAVESLGIWTQRRPLMHLNTSKVYLQQFGAPTN